MNQVELQLGDFIKGRLLFVEDYCKKFGLDYRATLDAIFDETRSLVDDKDRLSFLESRFFKGAILPTTYFPDWVDKVLLEAMTHILKGPNAEHWTNSSAKSCIPFEAGRFNAHRQADTVFRLLFTGKTPALWLSLTFNALYKKCYGEEAGQGLKVEKIEENHFMISLAHKHLEKATPVDCSTIIGYIYGSLEKLGANNIHVDHTSCATQKNSHFQFCSFDVTWG